MFASLRKFIRRAPAEPCQHEAGFVFDWYKEVGIATCPRCAEVFLATELGEKPPDWVPGLRSGVFDGL